MGILAVGTNVLPPEQQSYHVRVPVLRGQQQRLLRIVAPAPEIAAVLK